MHKQPPSDAVTDLVARGHEPKVQPPPPQPGIPRLIPGLEEPGRPAELMVLAEIGRAMGCSLHIDQALDRVASLLRPLIAWDSMAVSLVDSPTGASRIFFSTGKALPVWVAGSSPSVWRHPVLDVVTSKSSLVIPDVGMPPWPARYPVLARGPQRGPEASLIVPLLWRDTAIGALLFTCHQAGTYTESHVAVGERIAELIAGAVAHWELMSQLRRQAHEATIVAEIGRVLGSAVSLTDALPDFAVHLRRLVSCDRLEITIGEGDRSTARVWWLDGLGTRVSQAIVPLTDSLAESAIQRGTSVQRAEESQSVSMPVDGDGRMELPSWRTALAVPLTVRNETIGAMVLYSDASDAFGPATQAVAERVATQIAGIVGNLSLQAEPEQAVAERQIMADLAGLAAPGAELEPFLEQAVRRIAGVIEFDRLVVTRADHFQDLEITIHTTDRDIGGGVRNPRTMLTGSITAEVLRAGRGILLSINPKTGMFPGTGLTFEQALAGFGTLLAAPVPGGPARSGAVLLYSMRRAAYSSGQVELAERIGREIGNAFALYEGDPGVHSRKSVRTIAPIDGDDHSREWGFDFNIRDLTSRSVPRVSALVVDRQPICRLGLVALFRDTPVGVEAVASTPLEAANLVRRYRPRVILYGIHPGDRLDIAPVLLDELTVEVPRVLILAENAKAADVRSALKAGASSFLLKSVSPAGLVNALYRTAIGGTVIDPDLLSGLVGLLTAAQLGTVSEERSRLAQLTERDRMILARVCLGRKSIEIAKSLGLSEGTVRNRLTDIYRTLGVRGRSGATSFALRAGMRLDGVTSLTATE